jgi:hypothetical protein
MTTLSHDSVKCSVCGKNSKHAVLASTNAFGSMDLDTRPPEMRRSTMFYWIMECPHCGYVAGSLKEPFPLDKSYLETPEYKNFAGTPPLSELAQKFARKARIAEKGEHFAHAFWDYLHAAWASDDEQDEAWQLEFRLLALQVMEKFSDREMGDNERVLRADLLRKTGQFEVLLKEYEHMRFENELLNKIVQFQVSKARAKDTATYTVSDVPS